MKRESRAREHSLLGEASLYSWSPVLQGCIRLLHKIQIKLYFLHWSVPVLLNWRPDVQWSFPQTVSVLCPSVYSQSKMFVLLSKLTNLRWDNIKRACFWVKLKLTCSFRWNKTYHYGYCHARGSCDSRLILNDICFVLKWHIVWN